MYIQKICTFLTISTSIGTVGSSFSIVNAATSCLLCFSFSRVFRLENVGKLVSGFFIKVLSSVRSITSWESSTSDQKELME